MNIDLFFFEYRSVLKNKYSIFLIIKFERPINEQINKNYDKSHHHEYQELQCQTIKERKTIFSGLSKIARRSQIQSQSAQKGNFLCTNTK